MTEIYIFRGAWFPSGKSIWVNRYPGLTPLEFSVIMAGKLSWYVTAAAASLLTGIVVFGTITALVWAIFNNFTFSVPILDIAMLVAALPSAVSIWFLAGTAYRAEQRWDQL